MLMGIVKTLPGSNRPMPDSAHSAPSGAPNMVSCPAHRRLCCCASKLAYFHSTMQFSGSSPLQLNTLSPPEADPHGVLYKGLSSSSQSAHTVSKALNDLIMIHHAGQGKANRI